MANQLAKGWEDQGNNMVRNSANGQTVDYNHPIYQDALKQGVTPPIGDPGPQVPQAPGGPIGDPPPAPPQAPAGPTGDPRGPQANVAPPAATSQPAQGTSLPAPPTPPSPKPGPDWVPTQDGQGWVPPNHPLAWKAPAPAAPVNPGVTFDPRSPDGPAPPTQGNVNDAFRTQLLALMDQGKQPANMNDPAIRAQTDAYSAQRQIAQRQQREAAAEGFAAQGLDQSGAMDSEVAREFGDMGRDVGSFSAGLVGDETNRRTDLMKMALSMAGDSLSNDEKLALEKQIAAADDSTKRYGIDASSRLGQGDLDLRNFLGKGQLNLGLLQALMGGDQFNKRLGFDIGNAEAGYNRDALLSLMK